MGYVFISYSTKNAYEAEQIKNAVKSNGIPYWMAPESIPAGSVYASAINQGIKDCACMLLLLSKDAQDSEMVEREVECAASYRKKIITLQIGDFALKDSFHFYLSVSQMIKVYQVDVNTVETERIIDAVGAITGRNAAPAQVKIDTSAQKKRTQEPKQTSDDADYLKGKEYYEADNEKMAKKHYKLAAERGDACAQYELGRIYWMSGNALTESINNAKAFKYFLKAANQGHAEAADFAATCYFCGIGVKKNDELAAHYRIIAAEKGIASAQCILGTDYYDGTGVHQDFTSAVMWFTKSADQGYALGQYWLGKCYYFGKGVECNADKAKELWIASAKNGEYKAKYDLKYHFGITVE